LGGKHPTKLIVALLDKVPKSGVLRSNKSSEGKLLLLDASKGVLETGVVRSGRTRMRGWMMRCGLINLGITRYPIKVSPVK